MDPLSIDAVAYPIQSGVWATTTTHLDSWSLQWHVNNNAIREFVNSFKFIDSNLKANRLRREMMGSTESQTFLWIADFQNS